MNRDTPRRPPLPSLLRAVVLLALAATAAASQTEFPYVAGTDSNGWAQAVSNAAGRVLIESAEVPRGLWVDLMDEGGQPLAGIQVEHEGHGFLGAGLEYWVILRFVDPAGLRQEVLLWTLARSGTSYTTVDDVDPLLLELGPVEPVDLPPGLASIEWRIDSGVYLENSSRLAGWGAVEAFLQERWKGQGGRAVVKLGLPGAERDGRAIGVDLDRVDALETLMKHLEGTYQPVTGPLASLPLFFTARGRSIASWRKGVFLGVSPFEDESLDYALYLRHLDSIEKITSLDSLRAFNSGVHSLAGVEHLVNLVYLDLEKNDVVDLSPLVPLINLRWLSLLENEIVDVGPLAALTKLERLDLGKNRIVDVGPLTAMTKLKVLSLWQNRIVDVSLASLTNLERLYLSSNRIVDLDPLAALTKLAVLQLVDNGIVDVGPLAALTNLKRLWLAKNEIVDLSPLASLSRLERLDLWGNGIVDVGPLASLTSLDTLSLAYARIVDLSPLAGLTGLKELDLSGNRIVDLSPLASLASLEHLDLQRNRIHDISSLVANAGLGKGDYVNLWYNQLDLDDQAVKEQIATLKARGVRVYY